MFTTVEQCKQIVSNYLQHSGRGGFMTGVVSSVSPLVILAEDRLPIAAADLYVTDNCIGLTLKLKSSVVLRRPLQKGDGVLLLCRPDNIDGVKYVLLDRIQPYEAARTVSGV
ncbi:MAG: DUF2577 family protein [Hydrogenoanaerobacterium sp.]